MPRLDGEDGAQGQEGPGLIAPPHEVIGDGVVGHGVAGQAQSIQHLQLGVLVPGPLGFLKLGDEDPGVVLVDVESHEGVIDEVGVGALEEGVAPGGVGGGGVQSPHTLNDHAACVEHGDAEHVVLADDPLPFLEVPVRHGVLRVAVRSPFPSSRRRSFRRPHLKAVEHLPHVVAAALRQRLRRVHFHRHALRVGHLHGASGYDGLDGPAVSQVEAVGDEGPDLLGLPIVADADDGDLAVLDHLDEFGHAGAIPGPHAVHLVHDDDALLLGVVVPPSLFLPAAAAAAAAAAEIQHPGPRDVPQSLAQALLRSRVGGVELQEVSTRLPSDEGRGGGLADAGGAGEEGGLLGTGGGARGKLLVGGAVEGVLPLVQPDDQFADQFSIPQYVLAPGGCVLVGPEGRPVPRVRASSPRGRCRGARRG
mmetsp:Transcript_1862/g.4123  ORF Transcript_1862/g.4123 Transcript_1862/m.4123 type:complete len:421 (+) Transcript_1862:651-1913(+)